MNLNTYVRQEAWFTIHSTNADQKVQNYFQVFWPAICECGPHILHLRPGQLITILEAENTADTLVTAVFSISNLPCHEIIENNAFTDSFNLFHTLEEQSFLSTHLNTSITKHI